MTEYQSCDNCKHSQKKDSEKPCSECEYINKEQIFTKWESGEDRGHSSAEIGGINDKRRSNYTTKKVSQH